MTGIIKTSLRFCLILGWMVVIPPVSSAEPVSAEMLALFENDIRPLLLNHCIECHSPKKSESGLRLDDIVQVQRGGDSGPAIDRDDFNSSLMLKAIRHEDGYEMPPGKKLTDPEILAVTKWIQAGAPWPEGVKLAEDGKGMRSGDITDEERNFWSFRPIVDPEIPGNVVSHPHPIDRFLSIPLEAHQLSMRRPAEKQELLRRATFDLTGLPPTPEEMSDFLQDESPQAFEQVIERLLSSTAYGERWGRHWLDIVRYADTAGETADYPSPLAFHYRNWVIQSINRDLPYDEFIRQQIAGDLMAQSQISAGNVDLTAEQLSAYRDLVTATGFVAISRRFGFDSQNYQHLTIQDTLDTVGQSVLGLTIGCARCHDHKFDPVTMADYYAWFGIFDSTKYAFPGSEERKRPSDLVLALPPDPNHLPDPQRQQQLAAIVAQLEALEKAAEAPSENIESQQTERQRLITERDRLQRMVPADVLYAVIDSESPHDSAIQLRGEPERPGKVVPRRNLDILGADALAHPASSGREELARWLTDHKNPLTSRVMINRIWQYHFGRGLVRTENDFGTRGERPTHPELLDWLASRFIESGWSLKTMHRLIMTSAAYQQSSEMDDVAVQVDPDSRWLWRFPPRRLSAEEIRDAMLSVSGLMDRTPGGAHPFPPVDTWNFSQHDPFYAVYHHHQRSVYLMQQRLRQHPFLGLFDGADPNASTAHRQLTTVPTQALYLMNNEFVHECSRALTQRLQAFNGEDDAKIGLAYRLTLGREPTAAEIADTRHFLQSYSSALTAGTDDEKRIRAWDAFGRTLLVQNEFLYVR